MFGKKGNKSAKAPANAEYRLNTLDPGTWDLATVIFGVVTIIIGLAFFFGNLTVSVDGTGVAISHAMVAFSLLVGAMVWALVEIVTRPSRRHLLTLVLRFFGSFVVGFAIGLFLAYYADVGQYIFVPALVAHQPLAIAELFMMFVVFMILVIDGVYLHSKTYIKHARA